MSAEWSTPRHTDQRRDFRGIVRENLSKAFALPCTEVGGTVQRQNADQSGTGCLAQQPQHLQPGPTGVPMLQGTSCSLVLGVGRCPGLLEWAVFPLDVLRNKQDAAGEVLCLHTEASKGWDPVTGDISPADSTA